MSSRKNQPLPLPRGYCLVQLDDGRFIPGLYTLDGPEIKSMLPLRDKDDRLVVKKHRWQAVEYCESHADFIRQQSRTMQESAR